MKNIFKNQHAAPYLFLSPYFIAYTLFGLFPIVFTFYISFTEWNGIGEMEFVAFKNYIHLFNSDSYFFKSVVNTVIFLVVALPIKLTLGLLLASLLYSPFAKGKAVFKVINFLPFVVTPVAIGIIFGMMFDWQAGIINKVLLHFHLTDAAINWLQDPVYVRMIIILMIVWKGFGYSMLFYLAGLANVPKELYEAAEVDGATGISKFFKITLPLLKPITAFLILTGLIGGLQLLEEPMLLIQGSGALRGAVGGPDRTALTAIWNMYDTAFGTTTRLGLGSAIAYGLCMIIIVLTMISNKLVREEEK